MAEMTLPRGADGVLIAPYLRDPLPGTSRCNGFTHMDIPSTASFTPEPERVPTPPPPPPVSSVTTVPRVTPPPASVADGVPVDPRQLSALVGNGGSAMSKQRMAEIAASM